MAGPRAGSYPVSHPPVWLALHFAQLPIDRQPTDGADEPRAVVLQEGPRKRIMACNQSAAAYGIKAGVALKNAYALAPQLIISDFDPSEQQAHLEQLTLWALHYSSWVSPQEPDLILLEIGASLNLFNGLDNLLNLVHRDAAEQRVSLGTGVAPTPAAATLFARMGMNHPVTDTPSLKETLRAVPVGFLPLEAFTLKGLRQSGLRTLGELQSIPPAALTRRFGTHCTDLLYKLDGRLPDPQPAYQAPETFAQSVDLPLEAQDCAALAFPLNRLMSALGGFLKARDKGVCALELRLFHHRRKSTRVGLKFLDPTADMAHLFMVANERLAALELEAPVIRLILESSELASMQREGRDLFQQRQAQSNSIEQVMDKLVARLGKESLYCALPGNDHRPEKAWMSALLEGQQPPERWPARPIWLLREPYRLTVPVQLKTLPERIENGWWDENDVRRDYHIAVDNNGSYLWVYRQRHDPQELWVHGLFA